MNLKILIAQACRIHQGAHFVPKRIFKKIVKFVVQTIQCEGGTNPTFVE
jgi:hypothetical protein